jgi:hypothetical protein
MLVHQLPLNAAGCSCSSYSASRDSGRETGLVGGIQDSRVAETLQASPPCRFQHLSGWAVDAPILWFHARFSVGSKHAKILEETKNVVAD